MYAVDKSTGNVNVGKDNAGNDILVSAKACCSDITNPAGVFVRANVPSKTNPPAGTEVQNYLLVGEKVGGTLYPRMAYKMSQDGGTFTATPVTDKKIEQIKSELKVG